MEAPGYWDDPEKSQEGMKELKNLKDEAEDYRAAGTIGIDTQILVPDLHIDVALDIRHDVQRYKGSLPLALRVEG